MFNPEFFPTPPEVIDLMIEPLTRESYSSREQRIAGIPDRKSLRGTYRILDPSAGRGDILSHLKSKYDVKSQYRGYSHKYYAIEIEPELRAILKEKGFNPIAFDFLQFQPDQLFDLIVMNPPFSEGAEHLLHAWDILPHGDIVCLLNAETIRNPYTKKRQLLLELIEKHGRYEFFGSCFAEAARPTNVEVVCVWLKKSVKESTFNFDKNHFEFERNGSPDIEYGSETDLAKPGIIDSLVDQYRAARHALINKFRAERKFDYYMRGIYSRPPEKHRSEEEIIAGEVHSNVRTIEGELNKIRERFWAHIFAKTKVMDHTTSNFHEKVKQLEAESNGLAFSQDNIHALLEHFLVNSGQIMEDCICNVFDEMTTYHVKNKVWVEGWKTNSAHRVNMKIIIPDRGNFIGWNGWSYDSYYNKRLWPKLADLDKMLCWVMALSPEEVVFINDAISAHCDSVKAGEIYYTEKFVSTFFELRIYKKGTVHLKFRDKAVWEKFNGRVAQIRKWIAPDEEDPKPEQTPAEDPEHVEANSTQLALI